MTYFEYIIFSDKRGNGLLRYLFYNRPSAMIRIWKEKYNYSPENYIYNEIKKVLKNYFNALFAIKGGFGEEIQWELIDKDNTLMLDKSGKIPMFKSLSS